MPVKPPLLPPWRFVRAWRGCAALPGLPTLAVCLCLAAPCAGPAIGASFDCAKARTKLNRMICADAELSALDSRVWDAFGTRLNGISVAQYTHVRERHLTWRRQRGWYDSTVDALKDDYQRHLAWAHPPAAGA